MVGPSSNFLFTPSGSPIITSVTSATPTVSGFGTVTSNTQYSWRINDVLYVRGIFNTGTPAASQAQINVYWQGVIQTIDTTKCPGGGLAGQYAIGANTGAVYNLIFPGTNQTYVNMGVGTATNNSLVALNGNVISGGAGQTIGYIMEVPIVGW